MRDYTVNRFRTNRGKLLRRQIAAMAEHLSRDIVVLDVGGRPDYWANVGVDRIGRIDLLNHVETELRRETAGAGSAEIFHPKRGDARDLSDYPDGSIDFVHSNSVIEHVGGWNDMAAMADEMMRVGRAGWMQTPAWEFPIEPHFRAPFLHWFASPLCARMLSFSAEPGQRKLDIPGRRRRVESINLLSKAEVRALFPGKPIKVERIILAKSYIVRWMPDGVALP